MSESEKLLVKAPEACRLLSMGARKLWELTNCKLVPHVRIGPKSVFYCPDDLRAWIDQQKIPVRAGALG